MKSTLKIKKYRVRQDEDTICNCGQDVEVGQTAYEVLDGEIAINCGFCSIECAQVEVARIEAMPELVAFTFTF